MGLIPNRFKKHPASGPVSAVLGYFGLPVVPRLSDQLDGADDRVLARDTSLSYATDPVTFACVKEVATSIAEARLVVKRNGEEVENGGDPFYRLLTRPNSETSLVELLEGIASSLELSGNFYLERLEDRGRTGLQLLKPQGVRIEIGKQGVPLHYEYSPALAEGYTAQVSAREGRKIDPDLVIHGRYYNPFSDWYGLSPAWVASQWARVDDELARWLADFFANAARASGALIAEEVTPQDLEELRFRWDHAFGSRKALPPEDWTDEEADAVRDAARRSRHGTAAFGGKVSFLKLGSTPDEVHAPEITNEATARKCMVHGVPPILIGAQVGLDRSTFANYAEARRSLWTEKLNPTLSLIGAVLTRAAPEEAYEVSFDTSMIPVLRDEPWRKAALEVALKAFEKGAINRGALHAILKEVAPWKASLMEDLTDEEAAYYVPAASRASRETSED